MANDKIYSVDDILDEYSVDNSKTGSETSGNRSERTPVRNNSLADVLTDEYSLERILIESGFSGIPDKSDDDIIDISLIQIQDEPNHPETPEIISDIVDYFETDKHNEEQEFASIKQDIARAEKASEDPGILDFKDDIESISRKAEKILENVRKMHADDENNAEDFSEESPAVSYVPKQDRHSEELNNDYYSSHFEDRLSGRTEAEEDEARLRKFSLAFNRPAFSKRFEEEQNAERASLDAASGRNDTSVQEIMTDTQESDDSAADDAAWLSESPLSLKFRSKKKNADDHTDPKEHTVSDTPDPEISDIISEYISSEERSGSHINDNGNVSEISDLQKENENITSEEEKISKSEKASKSVSKPFFGRIFGRNEDKNSSEESISKEEKPLTEEEEDMARLKKFSLPLNKPSFSRIFGESEDDTSAEESISGEEKPLTEEEEDMARLKKFSLPLNKPSFSKLFSLGKNEEKDDKPSESENTFKHDEKIISEEDEDTARLKKFSLPLNKPFFSKLFGHNEDDLTEETNIKDDTVSFNDNSISDTDENTGSEVTGSAVFEEVSDSDSDEISISEVTESAVSEEVSDSDSDEISVSEDSESAVFEEVSDSDSDEISVSEDSESAVFEEVSDSDSDEISVSEDSEPAVFEEVSDSDSDEISVSEDSEPAVFEEVSDFSNIISDNNGSETSEEETGYVNNEDIVSEEDEDLARLKKFSLPFNKPSFSKLFRASDEDVNTSEDRAPENEYSEQEDSSAGKTDDFIIPEEKISSVNETVFSEEVPHVHFKSYRSATRIQDSPNKILKNPEDNIRYVNRGTDKNDIYDRPQKKRRSEKAPETKADIESLTDIGPENNSSQYEKRSGGLKSIISSISSSLNPPKQKAHTGKPLIEIKSTPETGYFSIDVDINENEQDPEQSSFIKNINSSFSNSARNHVDDYNDPKDAPLILNDLYDLKKNLSIKFLIELIALIISVYLTGSVSSGLHMPLSIDHVKFPQIFSISMFFTSAAVIFTSFPVITSGFRNLFRKKPDCDSLAAVSITFSALSAALSALSPSLISNQKIYLFTPVAIAAFMVNTLGKQLIVNRAVKNFRILTSSSEKHALFYIDDESKAQQLTKGTVNDYPVLAVSKKTDFAADFLKYTYSSDISDKLCRKAVPFAVIISAVLTLIAVIIYGGSTKTFSAGYISTVFSLFLSAFAGFGIPLVVNIPLANSAEEAKESKSIIFGYQSIDDFYDVNSVTVDASQLFPEHSIKLSAIKMFSDTKIDDAIIAAASIVNSSGSIFNGMFSKIIDNNTSLLEKVENYSYEESMGICGWIKNKRILFGTRQLMVNHNIEGMPPKSKEKDIIGKGKTALYLSVSGNLAAMFILKMKADEEAAECLRELAANDISVIVKSIDPVITVTRISKLFEIPEDMIRIVPAQYHKYCDKLMAPVKKASSSVVCDGSLSSFANALSETKYIHNSALTGLVMQSTAAIIALLLISAFMFLGILNQITPLMLVGYHSAWLLITMLIMKIKPR